MAGPKYKRIATLSAALLLVIAMAGGIHMLAGPTPTPDANRAAAASPRSLAATADPSLHGTQEKAALSAEPPTAAAPRAIASKVTMTAPAGTPADDPAPPRTHLTAESGLLADAAGLQGVNLRTSASLLKGNRFDEFIDALALEGANSPLAVDLTDLYARSAAEANVTVDNALDLQLACGMSVCALSASAPSKDVFDTWFKAFLENPTARHFGIGRHDRILEDGSVEYRLIFSNEPGRNASIMPPPQ